MNNSLIKLAVLGALGLSANVVMAAGFTALPASGATSAYISCNTTGNFGSISSTKPTSTTNNNCAVTSTAAPWTLLQTTSPSSTTTSPSGPVFTLVASTTRSVVMNNTYTGGTNVTVGSVVDSVWRNAAGTECIYGAYYQANTVNTYAAGQWFEVNDFARGGYAGKTVTAAYSIPNANAEVAFRIGRTFSAVQHRATGYTTLPLTGFTGSINGLATYPGTASASQQTATYNDNWVNFTTDANSHDDDATSFPGSPNMYVKTTCTSAAPVAVANALRFRQTGQEGQPFIEVSVTGYAPAGASTLPAPVNPF